VNHLPADKEEYQVNHGSSFRQGIPQYMIHIPGSSGVCLFLGEEIDAKSAGYGRHDAYDQEYLVIFHWLISAHRQTGAGKH
tara:strand:- start:157612 stop:157854 length:243 start_codon:yes stop_codon:yes gene_type:complete